MERCEVHNLDLPPGKAYSFGGQNYVDPARCPQCKQEERARAVAMEARERAKGIRLRQQRADIPRRYLHADLAQLITDTHEQGEIQRIGRAFVESNGTNPSGLICVGNVGCGKTYFGCALGNGCLSTVRYVYYLTALGLIRKLRSTWGSGAGESEEQVFKQLASAGLLILDEVGVGAVSPTEVAILVNLLDARYANLKPTVLIGNLTVEELTGLLSERIIDRFRQGGKVLVFNWPSRRGQLTDPDPGPDVAEPICY